MKDRIFFPLALVLVAGLVALAIYPGLNRLPTGAIAGDGKEYGRIEISGKYLNKIIPTDNAAYRLIEDAENDYLLEVSADSANLPKDAEFGPHFRIDTDIEMRFADKKLRITVKARPGDDATRRMAVNYTASKTGDSGWQFFDLGQDMTEATFFYDVPSSGGVNSVDYLGIRPITEGGLGRVVIEEIIMEQVQE